MIKYKGENIMNIANTANVTRTNTKANVNKGNSNQNIVRHPVKRRKKTLWDKINFLRLNRQGVIVVSIAVAIIIFGITSLVMMFAGGNSNVTEDNNNAIADTVPVEPAVPVVNEIHAEKIRCTVSHLEGYTRSGEYTREGCVGGMYEWLGRKCNLYEVAADGSRGELIGSYEFLDTGYGNNGSMERGESISVWCPSADACWDWVAEYGDYVYLEFID